MIKIGTDIVKNSRFEEENKTLFCHLFTPYERNEGSKRVRKSEYYASRFAAKEAYAKAQLKGFNSLLTPIDIEIRENDDGAPYFVIRGREEKNAHLSLSHDGDYSVAFVVIESNE